VRALRSVRRTWPAILTAASTADGASPAGSDGNSSGDSSDFWAGIGRRALVRTHLGRPDRSLRPSGDDYPPVVIADDVVDLRQWPGTVSGRRSLRYRLATLPAPERTALVLRYGAGLDDPALAQALGCGIGEARTLVGQGLALLDQLEPGPGRTTPTWDLS